MTIPWANASHFIMPKGYLMRVDEANRQLRAVERENKGSITVRLTPMPANAVDKPTSALNSLMLTFRLVVGGMLELPELGSER